MRMLLVVLVVSQLLAGCTVDELIPDPPGWEEPDWVTEYHNFTLEDTNNSSLPEITFGSNDTFVEMYSVSVTMHYNGSATNETNYTYPIKGYVSQDGFLFNSGFAPNMGNVSLHLVEMKGFDYNCTVVYRVWNGGLVE